MRVSPPTFRKLTTSITGLLVQPRVLPLLRTAYTSTLSSLSAIPESSPYRQGTHALTTHRLSLVERALGQAKPEGNEECPTAIEAFERAMEAEAGAGKREAEEWLEVARDELQLVGKMIEWKAWEPLQVQTPPGTFAGFKADD